MFTCLECKYSKESRKQKFDEGMRKYIIYSERICCRYPPPFPEVDNDDYCGEREAR